MTGSPSESGAEPTARVATAHLATALEDGVFVVSAGGDWVVSNAGSLDAALLALAAPPGVAVRFDLSAIEALDTTGAWLIHRTAEDFEAAGNPVELAGGRPDHLSLIERVGRNQRSLDIEPRGESAGLRLLNRIGAAVVHALGNGRYFLGFFGTVVVTGLRLVAHPRRFRMTSFVYHMEQVGLNAVPIVGLISFLIGVVLAYQGADQLRRFGAEIFVVDLVAISVLREIGILLTAIVVAGRSGSAFTAQIGSMKLNQEVDAMRTMGLDPIEVLVIPRVLALAVMLPGLAFISDIMGLLGGALMAWASLDISPALFLERLTQEIDIWSFWVGIIKAPFFAVIIAMVGCAEGFRVTGSAESVGRLTTASVVQSIFLVIVGDALFSMFFATLGI